MPMLRLHGKFPNGTVLDFKFIMPSSVIANMIYDETSHKLRVVFVSGAVYEYKKVPAHVYLAMKTAGSKGTYLNKHIKGNYSFTKIN